MSGRADFCIRRAVIIYTYCRPEPNAEKRKQRRPGNPGEPKAEKCTQKRPGKSKDFPGRFSRQCEKASARHSVIHFFKTKLFRIPNTALFSEKEPACPLFFSHSRGFQRSDDIWKSMTTMQGGTAHRKKGSYFRRGGRLIPRSGRPRPMPAPQSPAAVLPRHPSPGDRRRR